MRVMSRIDADARPTRIASLGAHGRADGAVAASDVSAILDAGHVSTSRCDPRKSGLRLRGKARIVADRVEVAVVAREFREGRMTVDRDREPLERSVRLAVERPHAREVVVE